MMRMISVMKSLVNYKKNIIHEAPICAKRGVDTQGLGRRAARVGHSDVRDEGLKAADEMAEA